MGLVDKLTELDQAIWKQYEKVTQYCNKEYGWNKYDLMRKANSGAAAFSFGEGVYASALGVISDDGTALGFGLTIGITSMLVYYLGKNRIERRENFEKKLLEGSNFTLQPHFWAGRPIAALL